MKRYLLFLILFGTCALAYLQTATINGHVSFSRDSFNVANIRLVENGVTKYGCQADSNGNFTIKEVVYGNYEFIVTCGVFTNDSLHRPYGSYSILILPAARIENLQVDLFSPSFIEIHYPGTCEYDKEENRKGICPEGHQDKIIPIVYGYPSRKTMNAAKRGKFILGGCIVSGCDPHWHCTLHNKNF